MQHNRFSRQQGVSPLSQTVAAVRSTGAFLICPTVLSPGFMGPASPLLAVYHQAYEFAQAVAQPSILERLQNSTLN
jgi:hypothetical protein